MAPKRPKRPRDPVQLGKLIVDLSVGEAQEEAAPTENLAVAFVRQDGEKGGPARARALTPERRREIALDPARTRWGKRLESKRSPKGD
jgi:hypothetical protein